MYKQLFALGFFLFFCILVIGAIVVNLDDLPFPVSNQTEPEIPKENHEPG